MSWRALITEWYAARADRSDTGSKPEFYPAASADEIAEAEKRLNTRLPESIRSLLLETNGVMDMMAIDGGEWFESMWLLWTVAEIVEQNEYYRSRNNHGTYDRDFRELVFFAHAGCDSISFAFPAVERGGCAPTVSVWRPIEDELEELAPSLETFLRGWITGRISV